MNKLYLTILFLFVALTSNAQQYPTVQTIQSNFETVFKYIENDIKYIETILGENLTDKQKKELEAVFYNKFKHIAGSDNLNNFENVVNSTSERLLSILGPKSMEKLALENNAMTILSGRIYLNPNAINAE